ncbi:mCG144648, partial [Mus musculus]
CGELVGPTLLRTRSFGGHLGLTPPYQPLCFVTCSLLPFTQGSFHNCFTAVGSLHPSTYLDLRIFLPSFVTLIVHGLGGFLLADLRFWFLHVSDRVLFMEPRLASNS